MDDPNSYSSNITPSQLLAVIKNPSPNSQQIPSPKASMIVNV